MKVISIHANSFSKKIMEPVGVIDHHISLPGHDGIDLKDEYNLLNLKKYLIEQIGDEEVILVGNSIGGILAHEICNDVNAKAIVSIGMPALSYEVLEGAILQNDCTSVLYNENLSDSDLKQLVENISEKKELHSVLADVIKQANPKVRPGLLTSIGNGHMSDHFQLTEQFKGKILYINCLKDAVINGELYKNIKNGDVVEVDGGHLLPIENPIAVNKIIEDFIKGL